MIRKLLLALTVVAMVTMPVSAWAREERHEFHGRPDFHGEREEHGERHERWETRPFFVQPPSVVVNPGPYVYGPACGWQQGYWANQTYVDAYGNYSTVPQWVPPQYVCS